MSIEVEGPDGAIIEFPDGTPPETMKAALARHYGAAQQPQAAPSIDPAVQNSAFAKLITGRGGVPAAEPRGIADTIPGQFTAGVAEGFTETASLASDALNQQLNPVGFFPNFGAAQSKAGKVAASSVVNAVNKATGAQIPTDIGGRLFSNDQIKEALQGIGVISPRSRDRKKRVARRVGQGLGEVIPLAAGGVGGIRTLASGLSSGAGGAAAQQLFPDNQTAEAIGSVLGGLAPSVLESVATKINAAREARKAIPTKQALLDAAGELYTKAEVNGFTAGAGQTNGLNASLRNIANQEGLITPKSGSIIDTMPKVKAVLKMTEEFAGETMTPSQMQSVRRTLQNAAQSADASEARVGSMMLQRFDDFASKFAKEFKEARQLYHRAKKVEILETARELAGARAGQFTGSGFENALRTEYRALDRKIIRGELKGFTEAEIQAIRRVARGTPVSNAARNVGRFAPNGVVSFGVTTGVPFAVGNAVGGPATGALAAAGASGVGYGGRALATKLGIEAADTAELLVRAGVLPQKVSALSGAQREALAAVLAARANDLEASNPQERP